MRLNQKDQRILKLNEKGMTPGQIAKKIGYSDLNEGVKRVKEALERAKEINQL